MKLICKGLPVEGDDFIQDQELTRIFYGIHLPTTKVKRQSRLRLYAYVSPSKQIRFLEVVQHERDNFIYLALWDYREHKLVNCGLRPKFPKPNDIQIIENIKLAALRAMQLDAIKKKKNHPVPIEG